MRNRRLEVGRRMADEDEVAKNLLDIYAVSRDHCLTRGSLKPVDRASFGQQTKHVFVTGGVASSLGKG